MYVIFGFPYPFPLSSASLFLLSSVIWSAVFLSCSSPASICVPPFLTSSSPFFLFLALCPSWPFPQFHSFTSSFFDSMAFLSYLAALLNAFSSISVSSHSINLLSITSSINIQFGVVISKSKIHFTYLLCVLSSLSSMFQPHTFAPNSLRDILGWQLSDYGFCH